MFVYVTFKKAVYYGMRYVYVLYTGGLYDNTRKYYYVRHDLVFVVMHSYSFYKERYPCVSYTLV